MSSGTTNRPRRTSKPRLGRNFHKLFTASAVSAVGDGMYLAALPLLVVQFANDPTALGLVVTAAELPWVLFSLHAGALADRLDRRRVMVWADICRCLVLVCLSALVVTSQVNLAWVVFAAFALGVGQVFFEVAAQSAIPDLVSRDQEHLSKANGRIAAAQTNGEQFTGPPLGSALFGLLNVLPFAGNAVSFGASAALIWSIKDSNGSAGPTEHDANTQRKRMWKEIVDGVRWLSRNRPLRILSLTNCLGNLVFGARAAMLVLLAKNVLGLSDVGYGLLLTAAAVGAFAGSFVVTPMTRLFGSGTVLLSAAVAEGLAIVALGLTSNGWFAGAMMVISGGMMTIQNVVIGTLRQQIVPRQIFGRVLSVGRLMANVGAPLGATLGGLLASAFAVQTPFLVGGIVLIVVAVLAYPMLSNRALTSAIRDPGPES